MSKAALNICPCNSHPQLTSTRATQMGDCGLNPDLCMVTAKPCHPLKGVFHTQKLSQHFALLAILLKLKHLLLANCVIVDQAVVQLNCRAHLSSASYDFLARSNCFVIIVQQWLITTMSILVKIVDSRLEYCNKTFSFRKQYNNTNLFVHSYERCLSKVRILQRFLSFCFFTGSEENQM